MHKEVYYLPGRGGKLNTGLGEGLQQRGISVRCRELDGNFQRLSFQGQLDLIARDLNDYWTPDSHIIAVSYGAYLLLHSLAEMEPCPCKLLLLSPIIGGARDMESMRFFSPPREKKLMQMVLDEPPTFPACTQLEIHVGEHDWQSQPERCKIFANSVKGKYSVLSDTGHSLGIKYVSDVLENWLIQII